MKTKLFTLLMTLIIIGIVIPAYAISPDKDKGEKSKPEPVKSEISSEHCLPSDLPPGPWYATVIITDDSTASCPAMECNLIFAAYPASIYCEAQSANYIAYAQYNQGTYSYPIQIPGDVPCVIIKILDVPLGSCDAPINGNTCCACIGTSTSCPLRICP